MLRAQSGEHSFQSELSDLMSARQEWHAVLDDVLEGTHEDLEAIMSSARYFATHVTQPLHMHSCTCTHPPRSTCAAHRNAVTHRLINGFVFMANTAACLCMFKQQTLSSMHLAFCQSCASLAEELCHERSCWLYLTGGCMSVAPRLRI